MLAEFGTRFASEDGGRDSGASGPSDDSAAGLDPLIDGQVEALRRIEKVDRHIQFLREKAAEHLGADVLTLGRLRRAAKSSGDPELEGLVVRLDSLTESLVNEAKAVAELAAQVEKGLSEGLQAVKDEIGCIGQGKRLVKAYRSMGSGREAVPRFVDQER